MIYLTRSALAYAANICEELPGYQVGIAVYSMSAVNNIVDIINMNVAADRTCCRVYGNYSSIIFCNKSRIDIFTANENRCGKKVHLLIVDKAVDREVLSCVLRPMEAWDYYKTSI